jgi:hypothetical protein
VTGGNLALQFGGQSTGYLGGDRVPGFKGHRQLPKPQLSHLTNRPGLVATSSSRLSAARRPPRLFRGSKSFVLKDQRLPPNGQAYGVRCPIMPAPSCDTVATTLAFAMAVGRPQM